MWALLRLPRFGGATHANRYDNWSRHSKINISGAREAVARFLEKISIEPVILHELANKGRALITKFNEEAGDIGFAVVLMTPDDIGGKVSADPQPHARQNVVFELGFFIGRLGPDRVAAIVADNLELPSDY
jgi:predicted nucleotide-binding protein